MDDLYEFIIIGSGAGGAPIAHELVKKGKKVLVLEKGPKILPQYEDPCGLSGFKRDELFGTGAEKIVNIPEAANNGASYFTSHVEPDLNDEPHIYRHRHHNGFEDDRVTIEGYTAQVVGGGTQIYGAVSLRFTEDDFRLRTFNEGRTDLRDDVNNTVRTEARDWPITYDELEPYYTKAELMVGINGTQKGQKKRFSNSHTYQTPLPPNPISKFAEDGLKKLNMDMYRTPLAVITEDHPSSGRKKGNPKTSYVNRYGDPMGFKSSTWVALLSPISKEDNFTIRCNCNVTHLQAEDEKVSVVHFRDESGNKASVKGGVIIVACSAIESVRLLHLSAAEDPMNFGKRLYQNDLVGKYFLTHCFGGAEVRVPGRFDKSISLDSDWATDHCATAEFIKSNGLWAGGAIYNNTSDQALPISLARTHGSQDMDTMWQSFIQDSSLTGERLLEFFDHDFGRRLSVSFMANQVPMKSNRIELHPTVRDKWNRPVAYIIKDWHPHDKYLMDVLSRQCEAILRAGVDAPQDVSFGGIYSAENARARIANHILGGARFGNDPADSVLDKNCRVWNFENLYVTDGAFMPTSGSGNPTLTIEANSFRIADHLLTV